LTLVLVDFPLVFVFAAFFWEALDVLLDVFTDSFDDSTVDDFFVSFGDFFLPDFFPAEAFATG